MQDKTLTDKQKKFIELYFKYNSVDKICKELDISRQTYYNYLNNDLVRAELDSIRADIMKTTTIHLQNNLRTCSDKLVQIINDDKTPPQTKVNAINSVFNITFKLTEQVDYNEKLDNLTKMYNELVKTNDSDPA